MQQIPQNQFPHDTNIPNHVNPQEAASRSNLADQPKLKRIKTRTTIVEHREDEDLVYEKVKNSRFKQQRLPAWRPVPTIMSVIIVFSVFGIVFIILGIILLVYSNKVKSVEIEYQDCGVSTSCQKVLRLDKDIDEPVFIYYQLDGFFQNSRRYVKSKNMDQLQGDKISDEDDCKPAVKNSEMDFGDIKSINGKDLVPGNVAIPCGLMAKTFFNDTYQFSINNERISVNETDITFAKDRDLYKKNPSPDNQWHDLTDEHFIVWMRPSGLPNPKKLWGRINRDLKNGDLITIDIQSNYNVSIYEGKKKIVLSNATKFGGKNKFLGISYIVVGVLIILCAIIFPIGYKFQQEKEKNL